MGHAQRHTQLEDRDAAAGRQGSLGRAKHRRYDRRCHRGGHPHLPLRRARARVQPREGEHVHEDALLEPRIGHLLAHEARALPVHLRPQGRVVRGFLHGCTARSLRTAAPALPRRTCGESASGRAASMSSSQGMKPPWRSAPKHDPLSMNQTRFSWTHTRATSLRMPSSSSCNRSSAPSGYPYPTLPPPLSSSVLPRRPHVEAASARTVPPARHVPSKPPMRGSPGQAAGARHVAVNILAPFHAGEPLAGRLGG